MVTIADNVKVMLQEKVEKVGTAKALNMFRKEFRRVKEYDSEECPEQWREAVKHVRTHGRDDAQLLQRFGQRVYIKPREDLERLISIYNHAVRNGASFHFDKARSPRFEISRSDAVLYIDLERFPYSHDFVAKLREKGSAVRVDYRRKRYLRLDDRISGISLMCIQAPQENQLKVRMYGIPNIQEDKDAITYNGHAFHLGHVELDELAAVGERRFMYTFGIQPATEKDIIGALVRLNNFPEPDDDVTYTLKERQLSKLKHSEGIALIHKEAKEAQEQGLFADVKVYELVGEKMPKPDPVIIGVDHFGQQFPIVYWAGDTGIKKTKK